MTFARPTSIWFVRLAAVTTASALLLIASLQAQQDDAAELTILLRPHCEEGYDSDTWIYGAENIPADGWTLDPDEPERCADFPIQDPATKQTPILAPGDILDLDIVVENPGEIEISRVGAWLTYDTNVLRGISPLETFTDVFSEVTPGQADFNAAEGRLRLEVSAPTDEAPSSYWLPVARVRFAVQNTSLTATPITFYDDQPNGKTHVTTTEQSDEGHEVNLPTLGTLMVRIDSDADSAVSSSSRSSSLSPSQQSTLLNNGDDCTNDDECSSSFCDSDGFCSAFYEEESIDGDIGALCTYSEECVSGVCYEGQCQSVGFLIPNDGACQDGDQCESGICSAGLCAAESMAQASSVAVQESSSSLPPPVLPNGSSCTAHSQCGSGYCGDGFCAEMPMQNTCFQTSDCSAGLQCIGGQCVNPATLGATGAACTQHDQCQSQLCLQGTCQPVGELPQNTQTAFGLLQVRNVRVTTAGDAGFLAWEPLQSSRLKAYNVYYGTTAGQYIQRKTVPGNTDSIALRGLPEGTQYFFAVKAISLSDEESAFSQEVSVVIGDPTTSSAPLALSQVTATMGGLNVPTGTNVPGDTGPSSLLVWLGLLSAGIGTTFATKRQFLVR